MIDYLKEEHGDRFFLMFICVAAVAWIVVTSVVKAVNPGPFWSFTAGAVFMLFLEPVVTFFSSWKDAAETVDELEPDASGGS